MSNENDQESTEDLIAEVLTSMVSNFRRQDHEKYGELYESLFPEHSHPAGRPPTPREFSDIFREDVQKKTALAQMAVDSLRLARDTEWRVTFIYRNYNFVKTFITGLISKLEGGSCSVDKTSWLIQNYIQAQIDGHQEVPMGQPWNAPDVTKLPMWHAILDELPGFHNAHNITTLPALLEHIGRLYFPENDTDN